MNRIIVRANFTVVREKNVSTFLVIKKIEI